MGDSGVEQADVMTINLLAMQVEALRAQAMRLEALAEKLQTDGGDSAEVAAEQSKAADMMSIVTDAEQQLASASTRGRAGGVLSVNRVARLQTTVATALNESQSYVVHAEAATVAAVEHTIIRHIAEAATVAAHEEKQAAAKPAPRRSVVFRHPEPPPVVVSIMRAPSTPAGLMVSMLPPMKFGGDAPLVVPAPVSLQLPAARDAMAQLMRPPVVLTPPLATPPSTMCKLDGPITIDSLPKFPTPEGTLPGPMLQAARDAGATLVNAGGTMVGVVSDPIGTAKAVGSAIMDAKDGVVGEASSLAMAATQRARAAEAMMAARLAVARQKALDFARMVHLANPQPTEAVAALADAPAETVTAKGDAPLLRPGVAMGKALAAAKAVPLLSVSSFDGLDAPSLGDLAMPGWPMAMMGSLGWGEPLAMVS